MSEKIICFGETLWDMLPSGKMPGGAPMNVAIHLKYNLFDPIIISRLGTDQLGKDLISYLHEKGISTDYIQKDSSLKTGLVEVNISNKQEVTYTIVEPVAWDFITFDSKTAELVEQSDIFIFGSLAARQPVTRETLLGYLALAKFKICDINLRPPFYTPTQVQELLHLSDLAKMNHQELAEVASWLGETGNEKQNMQLVKSYFALQQLVVTRGENGAAVLSADGYWEQEGFPVEVEDTIGSGDSFLATYLSNYLQGLPVQDCLRKACQVGAFVATCKGATPVYNPELIRNFFKDA